jgi:hypothetical protein
MRCRDSAALREHNAAAPSSAAAAALAGQVAARRGPGGVAAATRSKRCRRGFCAHGAAPPSLAGAPMIPMTLVAPHPKARAASPIHLPPAHPAFLLHNSVPPLPSGSNLPRGRWPLARPRSPGVVRDSVQCCAAARCRCADTRSHARSGYLGPRPGALIASRKKACWRHAQRERSPLCRSGHPFPPPWPTGPRAHAHQRMSLWAPPRRITRSRVHSPRAPCRPPSPVPPST